MSDSDWTGHKHGHIAETVHCMNRTEKSFRIIVLHQPYQKELFGEVSQEVKYAAIATNKEEGAAEVLSWYNQRREASENRIKE